MRNVGIWMDKKKAIIVTFKNENIEIQEINSEIDDFRPHGGSGSRIKGGPQDVVQDSKYLEKEKNQFKLYFKKLIPFIEDSDQAIILGPSLSGLKFSKELRAKNPSLYSKIISVNKADNMTINQLKARMKKEFASLV